MGAKLDRSPDSIVVWCPLCPAFAEIVRDERAGHDMAVRHDLDRHPRNRSAYSNAKWFAKKMSEEVVDNL